MAGSIVGAAQQESPPTAVPGAHATLAILALVYLLSFVDRMIPALLIDPIRADLHISDTQVSLLIGLAFALVYTTTAVPLAWLADRRSRKAVLIAGIAVWGAMTAACGMATGFWQMFVGRMGVGLGEAALTPTAYALVTDLYPPQQRSRAMSVFVVGGAAGAGIALIAGAAALDFAQRGGTLAPWRQVLLLLGGLTLLSIIPISRIVEPARTARAPEPAGAGLAGLLGNLWRDWQAFAPFFIAIPLMNLTLYASAAWGPALLTRLHHWPAVTAGAWLGGTQLISGIAGTLLFGWLGDRAQRRGRADRHLLLLAASCAVAAMAVALIGVIGSAAAVIVLLNVMTFATGSVGVLGPVALQAITDPKSRAQMASLWLLVANLVGIGAGPSSVALVSDHLASRPDALAASLALVCTPALLIGALVTWRHASAYVERARHFGL